MTDEMKKSLMDKSGKIAEQSGDTMQGTMFLNGADWYRNNVWHRATHDDMPQRDNAVCLIYVKDQRVSVDHVRWSAAERRFKYGRYGDVHFGFVDKWAYLDDLVSDDMNQ